MSRQMFAVCSLRVTVRGARVGEEGEGENRTERERERDGGGGGGTHEQFSYHSEEFLSPHHDKKCSERQLGGILTCMRRSASATPSEPHHLPEQFEFDMDGPGRQRHWLSLVRLNE